LKKEKKRRWDLKLIYILFALFIILFFFANNPTPFLLKLFDALKLTLSIFIPLKSY